MADWTPSQIARFERAADAVVNIDRHLAKVVASLRVQQEENHVRGDTYGRAAAYCEFLLDKLPDSPDPVNVGRADALKRLSQYFLEMADEAFGPAVPEEAEVEKA